MIQHDDTPVLETFDAFFRREHRAILGLAFVLSGSLTAAEELTQDAFVATRSWDRVGRMAEPGAWVRRVIANRSVSRIRRRAAEARALVRMRGRAERSEAHLGEPADTELWREARRLPQRQAQAVALHYLHDLSRREVAVILDCSEETVKTHLERARRTLARRLHDPEEPSR